jgi:hypothetical protein
MEKQGIVGGKTSVKSLSYLHENEGGKPQSYTSPWHRPCYDVVQIKKSEGGLPIPPVRLQPYLRPGRIRPSWLLKYSPPLITCNCGPS